MNTLGIYTDKEHMAQNLYCIGKDNTGSSNPITILEYDLYSNIETRKWKADAKAFVKENHGKVIDKDWIQMESREMCDLVDYMYSTYKNNMVGIYNYRMDQEILLVR